MRNDTQQRVYRPGQVAAILGVSEPTVRGMIRRQQIPAHRFGHRVFIFAADLEQLLQGMRSPAPKS